MTRTAGMSFTLASMPTAWDPWPGNRNATGVLATTALGTAAGWKGDDGMEWNGTRQR